VLSKPGEKRIRILELRMVAQQASKVRSSGFLRDGCVAIGHVSSSLLTSTRASVPGTPAPFSGVFDIGARIGIVLPDDEWGPGRWHRMEQKTQQGRGLDGSDFADQPG
jgi:hypothetical protein